MVANPLMAVEELNVLVVGNNPTELGHVFENLRMNKIFVYSEILPYHQQWHEIAIYIYTTFTIYVYTFSLYKYNNTV